MIQFILMLLSFAFPNTNANAAKPSDSAIITYQSYLSDYQYPIEDTGGETGQTPPPPKKGH
ncbi:hypothetical protein [Chryseobacterium contaminans]|uniref:hypothetical protein n=1 Tax=Chryseobacterium contaminans TaxID=1423959 RepID=UPI00301B1050